MGMVSFKFFAPVVLAALILVLSTITVTCEPNMYVIEVAVVEPKAKMVNIGNPKLKMMIMQVADQNKQASSVAGTTSTSSTQSALSCANEGGFCNSPFGINCCPGNSMCSRTFGWCVPQKVDQESNVMM